jgi:hypothetical protein
VANWWELPYANPEKIGVGDTVARKGSGHVIGEVSQIFRTNLLKVDGQTFRPHEVKLFNPQRHSSF